MVPWNSMSLLVVLMVSVMATRPVKCVNYFKNGVFTYNCDGWKSFSCSLISESVSNYQSALILSSLIKYTLGDFVADILWSWPSGLYRDCCKNKWVRSIFHRPISSFQIKLTNLSLAKETRWNLAQKQFCAVLNSSATADKVRLQSWWWRYSKYTSWM